MLELIEEWLTTQQTCLWGQAWDIASPNRRALAAAWFNDVMAEFEAWAIERTNADFPD